MSTKADAKFAELLGKSWLAIYNSVVNDNNPVLGSASDDRTITDFLEGHLSKEDYLYITKSEEFNYDLFTETIFNLYHEFDLYSLDPMYRKTY